MNWQAQLAVMDRAIALSRVGGDAELLQEMAQLFLEEYPFQLEAVRTAVQAGDPKALERSAHCLKGSISNFGAAEAQQAAFTLEMLGRKGDLLDAGNALTQLETALQHLQPAMASLAHSAA
ncbi:MAG TPA: Hpt domain-containing protein [Bryobacteraceae bacterium]|nr:Hpt domain-containing protein [Bryobacteraceae bacterium]